ncbi:MAG: NADPH:quinone reductase [Alphaproteobacteria bacterium]|nr:NADPH:quinone reductase [Alphaproteobacteria bacterium]
MRAAYYRAYGPAREVFEIGEVATPVAGKGEVLVRLRASGINPTDAKKRAGNRGTIEASLVIPHHDGAGMIEAVGDGVDPARVGERVWIWEGQFRRPFGTAAEYIAIAADRAAPLGEAASFAEGAGLGVPAITAWFSVFKDGPVAGQTVLVTGGAGAVGHWAVQFARIGGARVIATASSPDKAARARAAGATRVIDYRKDDVAKRVREATGGRGADRIVEVEFGGNLPVALAALRTGGVLATYASMGTPNAVFPYYDALFKTGGLTLHVVACFNEPDAMRRRAAAEISAWLGVGALVHNPVVAFPLEKAGEAHAAVEAGTDGKVVLEV